jgi:AmmeMemoRadiSam system protein A
MLGEQSIILESEKEILLNIARAAALEYLTLGERIRLNEKDLNFWKSKNSILVEELGCFISFIDKKGCLKGLIGVSEGNDRLIDNVIEYAIHAACHDPKFEPLTIEDLHNCDIEITIMGDLIKLNDPTDIKVGKHGLLIEKGSKRGLLLPQVAVNEKWSIDEFLRHTCLKAGLSPHHYPEVLGEQDTFIYLFSATVFGDIDQISKLEKAI